MFIDSNHTLYGVDKHRFHVWKLPAGHTNSTVVAGIVGSVGGDSFKLWHPEEVYVDRQGNLYVLDTNNHRVQKFINGSSNGITIAGTTGSGGCSLNKLQYPRGFVFDPTETFMYVADRSCHRVLRFRTDSKSSTRGFVASGGKSNGSSVKQLDGPWSIDISSSTPDELLIANYDGHSVMRWKVGNTEGSFVAGFPGTSCTNSSCLHAPTHVKLDVYMNMYVVDGHNHRVQMFCKNSRTGTTVAGTGTAGASATHLSYPEGIGFDSNMNLYVCDKGNKRVQKFDRL